jgi:hypothetical protein
MPVIQSELGIGSGNHFLNLHTDIPMPNYLLTESRV